MSRFDDNYAEGGTKGRRQSRKWLSWSLLALCGAGLAAVAPLLLQAIKDALK